MVEVTSTASDKRENVRKVSKCLEESLVQVIVEKNKENKNDDSKNENQGGEHREVPDKTADFEEAISAAGFGKFNIFIILCAFPAFLTNVYMTSSVSYIMSNAECDLNMSIADIGNLNIFTYAGMFCSALIWGFVSDTLGRKKVMVIGFLLLSIIELLASLSTTYLMLSIAKFCAGALFNGPFAVLISYISETHASSIRATVIVFIGLFYPFGNMTLPLLAWAVIPQDLTFSLFGGSYELHSWQIFLSMFTIPPLITGVAMSFLPESPKFLMSRGRNEEALSVFQMMFAWNNGLPKSEFPIKKLIEERSDSSQAPSGWQAIKGGFKQLKPLFLPPHLKNLVLSCFIMSSIVYGGNTLRLWFPKISTLVEDYYSKNTETLRFCKIMDSYVSDKVTANNVEEIFIDCVKFEPGSETYINSVIIGAAGFLAYLVAGCAVKKIGKRQLTAFGLVGDAIFALALYWSSTFPEIVALFAAYLSMNGVIGTLVSSIAVDLFPTSMRAMAVAVLFMSGRFGTILGGVTFSYLLEQGCFTPFLVICVVHSVAGILCFVLPGTSTKKME